MSHNLHDETEISDIFSQHFPEEVISEVRMAALPTIAVNLFEGMSRRFILPEEYKVGNFKKFYRIDFEDENQIYVATQTKQEDLIYLIELNHEGFEVGHGEVRIDIDNKDSTKPTPYCFVGFIRTEEDFQRRGLGERRLCVMNALSQALYGSTLYSGAIITEESGQPFMERLCEKGIIQLKEGKGPDTKTYFFK